MNGPLNARGPSSGRALLPIASRRRMISHMGTPGIRTSRIVGLSLLVGAFFTSQEVGMAFAAGRPISFEWDVLQELLYWVVWAFLSPVILIAVRRWPLDAKPAFRSVAAHAVIAVALAPVQTVAAFGLHLVALCLRGEVPWSDAWSWMAHQRTSLVWGVFMGVFFYWIAVGLYTALHYRRLYVTGRAELVRAQLDALRSQLRPHFLFNTLNAILVLIGEDPGKAAQMLLRLSSLLRRNLDEEHHEVSLRQELAVLDEYLDIQRVRFGDRLTVDFAIDASAAEARVPILLLQPLVENAIEHGASETGGATTIAVRATRVDGTLRLTVADNGPGPGDAPGRPEGIGLRNTRERLRSLYGELATLRLHATRSESGATGACVDIVLPFSVMPA